MLADQRQRLDHRLEAGEVAPQVDSVALQAGECADQNMARLLDGQTANRAVRLPRPEGRDRDDRGAAPRSDAVRPVDWTMERKITLLASRAACPALLSTDEDRTEAMLDWTWTRPAHERGSRSSSGPTTTIEDGPGPRSECGRVRAPVQPGLELRASSRGRRKRSARPVDAGRS